MSVQHLVFALCATLALSAALPNVAFAHDNGNRGRDRDRHHHNDVHDRTRNNVVKHYGHYKPHRNVVHYYGPRVGQRVVYYRPVPHYMAYHLRPLPRGHYYSMGGPDTVYVVSRHGDIITQIVRLLGY